MVQDFSTPSTLFKLPPPSAEITTPTTSSKTGKPPRSNLEKIRVSLTVTSKDPEIMRKHVSNNGFHSKLMF